MNSTEWLEPDGLGGFASGGVDGIRTRRYHALLLSAAPGSVSFARYALVNGVEAHLELATGARVPITRQRYAPDVVAPHDATVATAFAREPWPRWTFRIPDGDDAVELVHEIVGAHGAPVVALSWRLAPVAADSPLAGARLVVRPLLSGRDLHSTHHANDAFRFDAEGGGGLWTWRPYDSVPRIVALTSGSYRHDPVWYRNFQYDAERERGLDFLEDLASPGEVAFELGGGEAILLFAAASANADELLGAGTAASAIGRVRERERARRGRFESPLHRSADDFLVTRGATRTIIAGYPWFTDWGRDTFIAMRGLCIATGRLDDARRILLDWVPFVSRGMLPNLFPDGGREPEYNSVDASLWYVIAVHDFLAACERRGAGASRRDRDALLDAVRAILVGYAGGTRYGIRAEDDGLLAAGEAGVQLTWMDAKVGDWVVTPRIGKPVEIQALWLNALAIADALAIGIDGLPEVRARGVASFNDRFWNHERGFLYDVVDTDHVAGAVDAAFRPNQIFAAGGLPYPLLTGERARAVVDAVEAHLLTPLGLRSLAPGEPNYAPRYEGDARARDGAYHQGTVWPWLIAPFVDAWVRTRRAGEDASIARFIAPLLAHLDDAGLGHVSEIGDAESPFTPRGAPFQAWSLAALVTLTAQAARSER